MHDCEVVLFHDELEHAEYKEQKAAIKAKLQEQLQDGVATGSELATAQALGQALALCAGAADRRR